MKIRTLAQKIGLGYTLMVLVLAAAVVLTIWQVGVLHQIAGRLIEVREPTAKAGLEIEQGTGSSLAALQGWLIVGEEQFREQRRQVWVNNIRAPLSRFESLSRNWTNADNVARLDNLKALLDELEFYENQVDALAATDRQQAIALLGSKVLPLGEQVNIVLSEMVDDQRSLLRTDFNLISSQINFLTNFERALLGIGLLVSVLLSIFIIRSITRPVAQAVDVAEHIGNGMLDVDVNVNGSSELEALGVALVNMRDSLRAKTQESERFNWLTSGQNDLNVAMRGDKSLEQLATSIVAFMASYTGAAVGSLYLADEAQKRLSLMGGYAFAGRDRARCFSMGEGLVGQVAAGETPVAVSDIGEDCIRVRSSVIDAAPGYLYLCPFSFEDSTLGVLELGKFEPFSELEQAFVQSSMKTIAISLHSAVAHLKIKQLLEETQQQSEELQQQQEELEQTNEELEEQAQQLGEQQEELQTANEELEEQTQLIVEKNRELENASENMQLKARQLEISSKYKSEFLANMSHELRTPLNSLLILANDLAANAQGNLDDEQVESAQVISKSGQDLLLLINDVLDLSKVEAGRLEVNVTRLDLAGFADDLKRNFRRLAQEKNLTLDVSVDPSLPGAIRTDRHRLEQILNNLISNALKFSDDGGVEISFQRHSNETLSITVTDTGIGVAEDKQDTIFEAFVQAEGGTARKYGGTGLGLSICRELAKLLGGSVTMNSTLGEGSRFTLELPLEISGSSPAGKPQPPQRMAEKVAVDPGQSRFLNYPGIADQRDDLREKEPVVLIIEDDADFARVLAAQAMQKGLKYISAATGEDGLRLAAEYLPQAIILDLELPGINGHMVLKELKNDPAVRHIPVHIVSANEKSLDLIRYGAVDYLTKPVTKAQLDEVFERIEGFINRKMKNLLIVEDNEAMRKAIMQLIGNGDVQCIGAATAQEALRIYDDNAIDCIVLDVGLPDISGFELIQAMKKKSGDKMPPIIVYTGKELTPQENDELQQYTETIIVKGVKSEERLLDETALFLHRTVKDLPASKKDMITRLYDKEELLQGKQVLLVDDDMRNVFALGKVLKERGMDIHKAENGCAALKILDAYPNMDFVLMDIMMPEMDGYECMQRIRQRREFRELPILALTAKAMKEDRQKCIDAGANDYISKPVDIERLMSLMRIWVRK
ncbi:response regulator [Marinobacterium rhizophilum]|uniref:histidine kinase n=1 Tax=Marinobacterium rhizophilum TaxID=420402 RepID=A0ABY5HR73_9GAMM|nr:response regulator [Marinobacterium rhizophilum]UTW13401.1 response regulator [Marinobacterium rhizophilum]